MNDGGEENKIVHALRNGQVMCGLIEGVPRDWPQGHCWVDPSHDIKRVNCQGCLSELSGGLVSEQSVIG